MQARHIYAHAGSEDDLKLAAEILAQALAIDADYVPALLLSVYVYYLIPRHGVISDTEAKRLGNELIARVLAIDSSNGEALGLVAWDDWEGSLDLESAARRFSDALRTASGDLALTLAAGIFARSVGRHEESIALLERCVAADPVNSRCAFHLAQSYLWGNRLEDALRAHRKREALTGEKGGFYYVVLTLLLQGEPAAALAELESISYGQDHPQSLAARAMIMHDLDRHEESASALDKITGELYDEHRETAYLIAEAYAWIGDKNQAFEWLETGYALDERYGLQGYWFHRIMFLPIWMKLHDDLRWDDLRERTNMSTARLGGLEFSIPEWMSLNSRPF